MVQSKKGGTRNHYITRNVEINSKLFLVPPGKVVQAQKGGTKNYYITRNVEINSKLFLVPPEKVV
ncbi:hypothetical protein, partial [Butyricimonas paravirosa]|uniref:hypothetical protein n=1 Tax=Butyricimonas paravirosa TaxID=1472417 RepID=UPI002108E280